MKYPVKQGISIVALILLAGFLVFQARAVDQFKSSAMRFIASEAISFVAIPNLQEFFDKGTHPLSELIEALDGKAAASNFLTLVLPHPSLNSEPLPAQCRVLGAAEDLAKNGIVPASSLAIAQLDSGFKLALKLRDDGSGVSFLADILFPSYVRIAYDPEFEISEKAPAGDAPAQPKPNTANKYKFTFDIKGNGLSACLDKDWKRDGALQSLVVDGSNDHLYIPIGFPASGLTSGEALPNFAITCQVSRNSEAPKPCGCNLIELGFGGADLNSARQSGCGQESAFKRRKNDISGWMAKLRDGQTLSIGNQYVALIDGFYVIEGFSEGRRPAAFQISTPTVSIVSDDSLLAQFNKILSRGKEYSTTIFAGARPDWIVDIAGISGLPMYLMTPIGVYISDKELQIDTLSNLEPQDMAIVQTIAAASRPETGARGWSDWRRALGGKLSDSSLKLYAKFLRSYFPDADVQLAKYSPLAQIAIDIMEQGTGAVVLSVGEFYSTEHVARLAIAVPDIDAENAGWLVVQSRRQSIARQARYIAEKAGALAIQRGADAKGLKEAAMNLYCNAPLWRLKSLEMRGPNDGSAPSKIKSKIELDEEAFLNQTNWSVVEAGVQFQRILPFADANVSLWGNAYENSKGVAERDMEDLTPKAQDFIDYVDELLSNLNDDPEAYQAVLSSMVPVLLEKTETLEAKRSMAKEKGMRSSVENIATATDAADAIAKVSALKEIFPNATDIATWGPAEVAAFCQVAPEQIPQSPMAFYDRKTSILYVVDSAELIAKLTSASGTRDDEGKLLVGFETPRLAELLTQNKIIEPAVAEQFATFPFSKVELSLAGRESGTGISARISLKKAGGDGARSNRQN